MRETVHRRAFDTFADRARERLGESLQQLTLYGSVAAGDERLESDVDVFAIVSEQPNKQQLHDIAFDVEIQYDIALSLVVRTLDEYETMRGSRFDDEITRGETVV